MRRSIGKQQARLTRQFIRRLTQTPEDRGRGSDDPGTWFSAGTTDAGTGEIRRAGISNITSTADPFYSAG